MTPFDASDPVIPLSDLHGKTIERAEHGYINGFSTVRLHFTDGTHVTIESDGYACHDLKITS